MSEGQRRKPRRWQLHYRKLNSYLHCCTFEVESPEFVKSLRVKLLLLKDLKLIFFNFSVGQILPLCPLKGQAHLGASGGKIVLINFENPLLRNLFNNLPARRAASTGSSVNKTQTSKLQLSGKTTRFLPTLLIVPPRNYTAWK